MANGNKAMPRIFISYSRQDIGFADQLIVGLEAVGFSTTIDRTDIHAGEDFERRLEQLIHECDTVVFVLTATSAESPVCRWEVNQALARNKRIVPILASPLGDAQPHEYLRSRHYIYFYADPKVAGSGFGSGLARLKDALSVDIDWVRQHTDLDVIAFRWQTENRPTDLLVRGEELGRLQKWREERPANAPELMPRQHEFLAASADAERTRLEEERAQLERLAAAQEERAKALTELSRRTRFGLAGVSLLALLSIAAAYIAIQQNRELQGAGLRLREGMTLKIADTHRVVTATEKWYRIATDYKLAIGVYRPRPAKPKEREQGGMGFLVRGESLRADWKDHVVFLTAGHNIRNPQRRLTPNFSEAYVMFPGVDPATRFRVEKILFESEIEDLDIAILKMRSLPPHAVAVDLTGRIEAKSVLDGIAVLQWTARGFALGFGHGRPRPEPDGGVGDRLFYTYVTEGGASGAPVFDANSGNVACIHNGFIYLLPPGKQTKDYFGYCTSMSKIAAAVAARGRPLT